MGFHKVVYAFCDAKTGGGCLCDIGEASWGDSQHETIASYKQELLSCGWKWCKGNLICPECDKALKQAKENKQ